MRRRAPVPSLSLLLALAVAAVPAPALAQAPFSIADILGPGFPYELVSARHADRIAWIEYERGVRNVYTATPPDFRPLRLTSWAQDDGVDLTELQISDDGETVTFVRGHTPNREGWIANPASDPRGGQRVVYAASTSGGEAWPVADVYEYALAPDGRSLLYARDGQIHRVEVNPGLRPTAASGDAPLFRGFGDDRGSRSGPPTAVAPRS